MFFLVQENSEYGEIFSRNVESADVHPKFSSKNLLLTRRNAESVSRNPKSFWIPLYMVIHALYFALPCNYFNNG